MYLCRCLNGAGEPLDEVITPEMGKSFTEVCDSLHAIGFSEQVLITDRVTYIYRIRNGCMPYIVLHWATLN